MSNEELDPSTSEKKRKKKEEEKQQKVLMNHKTIHESAMWCFEKTRDFP